jgi:integrase
VTERRSRGEGGLSWSESRQRWIGRVSVGFTAMGKRRIVTVSGRTKTEAKAKLREVMRDHQDGFPTERRHRTVAEAVEDWLAHGMGLQEPSTAVNRAILARTHLVPVLGRRRLVELTVHDVDAWLADRATMLSTDTVHRLHGILRAVLRRAQAHDHVKRNVALLVDPPRGTAGRPSKALTADQAARLLAAAEADEAMRAYVVVSLLTGARTEELRALTWTHVDLEGKPPTVALWRSVRAGGETKTRQSRRTLELPARAAEALRVHRTSQRHVRLAAGEPVAGSRSGVLHVGGHRTGRGERPPLVPSGGRGRRLGRAGVDAARAAAQLRVVAIEHRDEYRGHLPPGWPRQQPRHRAGVPQGAAAGAHPRCERDGRPLPA